MPLFDVFRTQWVYTRIEYSGEDGRTIKERRNELDEFDSGVWEPMGETVAGLLQLRRRKTFAERVRSYLQEKLHAPSNTTPEKSSDARTQPFPREEGPGTVQAGMSRGRRLAG